MTRKKPSRFWRISRIIFRWSRITVWMLLLALLVAVIFLNTIGIPDFLKEPLIAELRERGWHVKFNRMRWHWYRGIVIDQPTFSPVKQDSLTQFSARRAELNVDFSGIQDGRLTLKSIFVREGEFRITVATNATPLLVEDIQANIQLLPGDRLVIEPFEAQFRDIQFQLSCDLTNVSAAMELSFLLPETQPTDAPETAVKKWFEIMEEIQFADEPEVTLEVSGDLRKWQELTALLKVGTSGATTPWGRVENVAFAAEMNPPGTTNLPAFDLQLSAKTIQTPWGRGNDFQHHALFTLPSAETNLLNCEFDLSGKRFRTRWNAGNLVNSVESGELGVVGNVTFSLTNFLPTEATAGLRLKEAAAKWQMPGQTNAVEGRLVEGQMNVHYDAARLGTLANGTEFSHWTNLHPVTISGDLLFDRVEYGEVKGENLLLSVNWGWPRLDIADLRGQFKNGEISGSVSLDVVSRELLVHANSRIDPRIFSPLLPRPGQSFLADWDLTKPPHGVGDVRVVLPPWTATNASWYRDVLPTLQIHAQVSLDDGSYHRISATRASSDILYSNMVWQLPNIRVVRPEGTLDLSLVADDRNFSFDWQVKGRINPNAIRPHLNPEQVEWLEEAKFSSPPSITARIRGHWGELETLGAEGGIHIEDFSVRGVSFSSLLSGLQYTNRVLLFSNPIVERSSRKITADNIFLDLHTNRVFFNNVASTIDPMLVAHIIGEDVVEVLSPYKFAEPPHVLLNGSIGLKTIKDADMHFHVAGKQFRWGLLQADAGSGKADWVDQTLTLTNLNALAYNGGELAGNAFLDFSTKGRAVYRLNATFTNVDVQNAVYSLDATNKVEGLLDGSLTLNYADTSGLHTWEGYGGAELRDGMIWEVPVFGIFTPVLDAIVPGLGKSRARSATSHFIITNGVAFSDDLEIRSSGFRMQYRGTISHDQRINARVLAEPLRDTWGVGKVLSTALMPISKLFEYKITGTVQAPEMDPVYVPKIVMMTLRPFKTIKKLLPGEKDESQDLETVPVVRP